MGEKLEMTHSGVSDPTGLKANRLEKSKRIVQVSFRDLREKGQPWCNCGSWARYDGTSSHIGHNWSLENLSGYSLPVSLASDVQRYIIIRLVEVFYI